jgi:hypothetical protein
VTTLSDQEYAWMYSQFLSLCIRKQGTEWQQFVTDLMHARHGGAFIQVDPAGRGDKGCDGWVEHLMLACYGAMSQPSEARVKGKIEGDFAKALAYWGSAMERWAFVHNNVAGLPTLAAALVIALREEYKDSGIETEAWPPQVLWDHVTAGVEREKLIRVIGSPPSEHPAGMGYLARCVESLARTRLQDGLDPVPPVPYGKIEANSFGLGIADLIRRFQVHTGHVRYYFSKASPGEQAQVTETLHAKYDGFVAELSDPDAVFHALCDDLIEQAFRGTDLEDAEQQRSAALMVVTHFFEICEIFKPAEEVQTV